MFLRCASSRSRLTSQNCRYRSIHAVASASGCAFRLEERHCADRLRVISPAFSSTFRCRETAGRLIENGSANSFTVASDSDSRARIARRVGSASAEKISLSRSVAISYLTFQLIARLVKYDAPGPCCQEEL